MCLIFGRSQQIHMLFSIFSLRLSCAAAAPRLSFLRPKREVVLAQVQRKGFGIGNAIVCGTCRAFSQQTFSCGRQPMPQMQDRMAQNKTCMEGVEADALLWIVDIARAGCCWLLSAIPYLLPRTDGCRVIGNSGNVFEGMPAAALLMRAFVPSLHSFELLFISSWHRIGYALSARQ